MLFNNIIFNDKDKGGAQPMARKERFDDGSDINAFLGEGTAFKGVLIFEGTVRVDGKIEGEISSEDTLIVGEKATVNAEIKVGNIIISGKISGNITAKNRIDIKSTGAVYGNIKTPVLTVEEGVIFQGSCDMNKNSNNNTKLLSDKKTEEAQDSVNSLGLE